MVPMVPGVWLQIPELVNQKHVQAGEAFQELARGAVRQRRIHLIEQILRADELAPVAVLQRLQQKAPRQSRFTATLFS